MGRGFLATVRPTTLLLDSAVSFLSSLTTRRFCAAVLKHVNAFVQVDHCALVRLTPGGGVQLFGAESVAAFVAKGAQAIVRYVDRYHRFDPIRRALHASKSGTPIVICRQRAVEVHDAAYRHDCYDAAGIVDRLSVVSVDAGGAIVSLELQRQVATGEFTDTDHETLALIVRLLAVACTRHVELLMHAGADVEAWRARLAAACPALTPRELDVATNLLAGRTLREAATALGVAHSSVVTYCARAYARMGVRNLRDLRLRLAGPALAPSPASFTAARNAQQTACHQPIQ